METDKHSHNKRADHHYKYAGVKGHRSVSIKHVSDSDEGGDAAEEQMRADSVELHKVKCTRLILWLPGKSFELLERN